MKKKQQPTLPTHLQAVLRPTEILLEEEVRLSGALQRLYRETLERLVGGEADAADMLEALVARSITATLWDYDRETGNGMALAKDVWNQDWAPERQRARFREASARRKIKHIALNIIRQDLVLLSEFRKIEEGIRITYDPDETEKVLQFGRRR